jgi:hypothetical protein
VGVIRAIFRFTLPPYRSKLRPGLGAMEQMPVTGVG